MTFDPLTAAFDLGKIAIEKIWPDPVKRAEEVRKLEELKQKGDLASLNAHVQLMLAQIKVNEESAKHKSLFVAGARPAVIWAGVFSLAYSGLVYPLLTWAWKIGQAAGHLPMEMEPPPFIESTVLNAIVAGLLGVGGMRSFDKSKGKETNSLK